jgi:CheY-like chemotaxis protein
VIATGRLLASSGFAVEVARGGEEGIEKAIRLQPDVIVTDIVMPETSGVVVCERLHKGPATRNIPLIVYTGLTDVAVLAALARHGVRLFAVKPCLPTVIGKEAFALLNSPASLRSIRVVTGYGETLDAFARDMAAYAFPPAA